MSMVATVHHTMTWTMGSLAAVIALFLILGAYQTSAECKNCITLGKEFPWALKQHWEACGSEVGDGGLRRRAYCALRRCKLIAKDGKLRKPSLLAEAAPRLSINATKILERCANQSGETPEDVAWNLLQCVFGKKALFSDLSTADGGGDGAK